MQGLLLPAVHLASQGFTPLQQLDAWAELHARTRQGQPTVRTALHLHPTLLSEDRDPGALMCVPAPSGTCAFLYWSEQLEPVRGAQMVGTAAESVT